MCNKPPSRSFGLSFIYLISLFTAQADLSTLESVFLINLTEINDSAQIFSSSQRRSSVSNDQFAENTADLANASSSEKISTTFEAAHSPPIPKNDKLTEQLMVALGPNPTLDDLSESIATLSTNKSLYNLSNTGFLTSLKSLVSAYVKQDGDTENFDSLPNLVLADVLPNISNWGESGSVWVKSLAQTLIEAFNDTALPRDSLLSVTQSFTKSIISLTSTTPDNPLVLEFPGTNRDPQEFSYQQLDEVNIYSSNRPADEVGFKPQSTYLLQQFSVGITQGALSSFAEPSDSLSLSLKVLEGFAGSNQNIEDLDNGELAPSLVGSVIQGIMSSPALTDQQDLLYEFLEASANGFLISTTVASTSSDVYLADGFYLDGAEKISKSISQYALLNYSTNPETDAKEFSVSNLRPDRIAEAIALGSAMGSQLATVLPKSMEFTPSWEIKTNIRRELAKAVARGNANGATESASWLSTQNAGDTETNVLGIEDIESVARASSLGSMMGNTGLAIYYPTKQLVPIINFTAQGSASGSTSAKNLGIVDSTKTESIEVAVARQSAVGSSLGAIFEPTVLLGLRPDIRSRDTKTIDHLEAAAFGSTYGAILGIELNPNLSSPPSNNAPEVIEKSVVVKQATKQGSIEGALAGAKLALNLEDLTSENLKSKAEILKAINKSNANAAATNNNSAVVNFQTNPNDMLLLMNKFGINPRFTNSAKIYKRPVILQNDEAPVDEEADVAIQNASPI
jgi:hypothetical protein